MDFSPKADFAKGQFAAQWTDVASSTMFKSAASAALLQMQSLQGITGSHETAAICFHQLEGARMFLGILMNLTTPPPEARKPIASENLDHRT